MQNRVTVKVSDLLKKFKSKEDRINYCREHNVFLPDLPGFDTDFFLQYLQGNKNLLPLGLASGFSFTFFTRENLFTKQHLFTIFQGNQELMRYLPNNISVNSLNRNYLLSVLAYADKNTYMGLYNTYKSKLANKATMKWDYYGVQISPEVMQNINDYIACNNSPNKKPFHLSKKGVPNQAIQRIQNVQGQQQPHQNIRQGEEMDI